MIREFLKDAAGAIALCLSIFVAFAATSIAPDSWSTRHEPAPAALNAPQ